MWKYFAAEVLSWLSGSPFAALQLWTTNNCICSHGYNHRSHVLSPNNINTGKLRLARRAMNFANVESASRMSTLSRCDRRAVNKVAANGTPEFYFYIDGIHMRYRSSWILPYPFFSFLFFVFVLTSHVSQFSQLKLLLCIIKDVLDRAKKDKKVMGSPSPNSTW